MAIEVTTDLNLVGTSQIVDGSVTSAKIAAGAVVAAGISAGAVGSAALASGAVGSAAIAAASVGTAAISSGAATSGDLLTANGSGGVSYLSPSVLISSTTVTSAANTRITFTGIPSGYKDLRLVWKEVVADSYAHIRINSDTLNHDYGGAVFGFTSTSGQIYRNTDADKLGRNADNGAFIRTSSATSSLSKSYGFATLYEYTSSSRKYIKWESYGGGSGVFGAFNIGYGIYNSTSTITSFSIGDFFGVGTIQGEFYLYGVRV